MASRILLLMDGSEDRRLLAEELSPHYDIVRGRSDEAIFDDFDLCVIDRRAFARLRNDLRRRRDAERPVHLPIMLLTSAADLARLDEAAWRYVDEVVVKPVERRLLRVRIETLLRTRRLSLDILRRAEEAEHATRARDDVLSIVAHDLRNPLGTIAGAAELLGMDLAEDERARQLAIIQRTIERMDRLIQDLLDVARMEAGRFEVTPSAEDVGPLLAEAVESARAAATARGVRLEREMPDRLPRVMADHGEIMRVLSNLIGNAIKFADEGGRVTVRAEPEPADRFIRISVSDTGPGIPPDQLSHLFERFWKARRKGGTGAGLGLAIARGIVEAHGGRIGVESEPGVGSTFHFTLPVEGFTPPANRRDTG
ncbi:MAG: ATP-binding protein [Gemmatimonadota bacterium]